MRLGGRRTGRRAANARRKCRERFRSAGRFIATREMGLEKKRSLHAPTLPVPTDRSRSLVAVVNRYYGSLCVAVDASRRRACADRRVGDLVGNRSGIGFPSPGGNLSPNV